MDKVAALKARYEFRDVAYSMVGDETGRGRNFTQHACLFCQSSDAFTVYEDSYFCFSCEASGDVIDLLAYQNKQTVSDFLRGNNIGMKPEQIEAFRVESAERARIRKEEADKDYRSALERLHEVQAWIRYNNNLMESEHAQQLWRSRGVPVEWQSYFELGYKPRHKYRTKQGEAITATLAMPVKKVGGEVLTIRHRLINPMSASDKYRPDSEGLGAHPFVCNTSLERAQNIVIVEGEIKSMVTFLTLDSADYQVIGVPSKSMMEKVVMSARDRESVVIIPDPDGFDQARQYSRAVGAKLLALPGKIDDLINLHGLDKAWMNNAIMKARRI